MGLKTLELIPVSFAEARRFVRDHHRHHGAPQGHKFSVGVEDDGELVGVVIVGRPVARGLDDRRTAEVTRVCVLEGHPNACSKLYGAARRAALAMGYRRVVTYILESEPGTSLKAAGWRRTDEIPARGWEESRGRRASGIGAQARLWNAAEPAPRVRWETT